jgi:general stress protein YciG
MTSQSPRIYTYKITFEEVPYYYYGSKKEKHYNQEYWGSPKTNKLCWELYTPKKQILELFDYTDEGYSECRKIEGRLIKPILNDPWCLNESCNLSVSLNICKKNGEKTYNQKIGIHKYTKDERIEISKRGGKTAGNNNKERGLGIFGLTEDEKRKNAILGGKISGNLTKERGLGIFGLTEDEKRKNAILGGKISSALAKERGNGIFGQTREKRIENGKKGGAKSKDLGVGVHGRTKEDMISSVKKTNSQKWECCETGYVSTAAGVVSYQRARGIDTSKNTRKRIS